MDTWKQQQRKLELDVIDLARKWVHHPTTKCKCKGVPLGHMCIKCALWHKLNLLDVGSELMETLEKQAKGK